MKNTFLTLLLLLPLFCAGQQPGFRKLFSTETTGAGFVDIVWDGEKLITSGQFLTDTAPYNALNGLLYMELDTNGNTLFTDIYFHPNDAVSPGFGNSLFASNNGIVYSMNQILYDTLIFLALYQNSERIKTQTTPIPGLQKWLYHCVDWNDNILLSGRRVNYQYKDEGMLIKSDPMGNEIWRKYYGSPGINCIISEPYIVDNNTIILPGGKRYWPGGPISNKWLKTWIVAVDSLGNIKSEWESPKNIESGVSTRMLKMPNGNWLYTTWEFMLTPGQLEEFGNRSKIVCRDSNFNLVWETYLDDPVFIGNHIVDPIPTLDGNYLTIGKWTWYSIPSICKFSPSGTIIWSFNDYAAPVANGDSYLGGVVEIPSGSIFAAGYVEDHLENKTQGLLIKLDKNGCMTTLCSGTTATNEIEIASKTRVYPNPTSDMITVSNPIGDLIEIFDMEGHLIQSVAVNSDEQRIQIQGIPRGAYIVRMQEKTLRVSYKIIKQ